MQMCAFCGEEFIPPKKETNRGNGKFCSLSCSAKAGNIEKKKNFYSKLNEKTKTIDIEQSVGNYIAGFVDGEGTFTVSVLKSPGFRIRAFFKVELAIDDKEILEWMKINFGCGNTYALPRRTITTKEAYRFVVQDFESLISKVIPFFDQYPLQGKKAQDFFRFKKILNTYIEYKLFQKVDISSLIKAIELLNKSYIIKNSRTAETLDGNYLAGLTDGEGSFAVKISEELAMRSGYRVKPTYAIQLSEQDIELLTKVRDTFNCGTVRLDKKRRIADYSIQSIRDLEDVIIPFFKKYQLRAKKRHDFILFKEVLKLCSNKEHLTTIGIRKIIQIRDQMNGGGAPNRMQHN